MAKKILCTLAFATVSINGIAFEPVDGGMQSVDTVPDDVADNFLLISGYEAVEVEPAPAEPVKAAAKGKAVTKEAEPAPAEPVKAAAKGKAVTKEAEPAPAEPVKAAE